MEEILGSSDPGVLLIGKPGTGKTAIILQLVEYSCFGRRKDLPQQIQGKFFLKCHFRFYCEMAEVTTN